MKKTLYIALSIALFSCGTSTNDSSQESNLNQEANNVEDNSQKEESIPNFDVKYIDGSPIKYVVIGEQVWTASNLKVDKFSNGVAIKKANSNDEWTKYGKSRSAAFCAPDGANAVEKNGYCYNGYVLSKENNICPSGWHIPTTEDFSSLKEYLGDDRFAKKIKSTSGWVSYAEFGCTNGNGDNSSGLNLYPAGPIGSTGGIGRTLRTGDNLMQSTFIMSSYEEGDKFEVYEVLNYALDMDKRKLLKTNGVYCRCVKNDSNLSGLPEENRVFPSESAEPMNEYEAAEMGDEEIQYPTN